MKTLSNSPEALETGVLPDPPSHFTVENSLAKEMLKMSFKDRQAIEEEIHGVRCGAAEETPELLERSLREFDEHLNARKELADQEHAKSSSCPGVPLNKKGPDVRKLLRNVVRMSASGTTTTTPENPADTNANKSTSTCYLNNKDIRLRFLRCECFEVDKAVQRLVDFLDFYSELFGDYVTERPIRLSDFSTREEEAALAASRNQYLPFRDRSGRRVLTGVGNCNFDLDVPLRFKILMFLHWIVSEDVETQRKGVVIVAWIFDEANEYTWEERFRPSMHNNLRYFHRKQNNALPVRVASLQQYYPNTTFFRTLSALYFFGLNSHHRSIYKAHFGTSKYFLCCSEHTQNKERSEGNRFLVLQRNL